MTEFVKVCVIVGIFTLYLAITGIPGIMTYHFLKEDKIETRTWKGLLVAYGIGLIIAVTMSVCFMIY